MTQAYRARTWGWPDIRDKVNSRIMPFTNTKHMSTCLELTIDDARLNVLETTKFYLKYMEHDNELGYSLCLTTNASNE